MGQLKYTAWENGASCLKPRPCGAGSDSGKAANRRLPPAWAAPNSSQRTCAARTSAPGVCSHLGTRTSGAQGRCEGTRVHPMRMDARSPPAPVLAFPTPRTDWGSRGIIPRFASPAPRPPASCGFASPPLEARCLWVIPRRQMAFCGVCGAAG